jgi:hypothetical protein
MDEVTQMTRAPSQNKHSFVFLSLS